MANEYGLEEVSFPDSVKTIGQGCFANCKALKEVRLPAKLKTISQDMFYSNCK